MVSASLPVLEFDDMTFQIGMVTDEGVLLASDRKVNNLAGFRHGLLIPKITVHQKQDFAHCSAGDDFCNTFTRVVREEIDNGTTRFADGEFMEVQESLANCVYTARERETEFVRSRANPPSKRILPTCVGGTTMLVFRRNGAPALWYVDTRAVTPEPFLVDPVQCKVAGVTDSPALFFLERYFSAMPPALDALVPLAVHAVLMAKCDFVEGIQVGLFTREKFAVLTDEELKPHIELSKEIDTDIVGKLRRNT
jgi:hypothetical protein